MADNTGIEWTQATWNPVVGCSVTSPGCTNCYAMKMAARLDRMGSAIYAGLTRETKAGAVWTGAVRMSSTKQVRVPFLWKKPRRIFVNSMSDLFHENLTDQEIDVAFAVMALCPQHTFQVLTKRADRMRRYMEGVSLERLAAAVPTGQWPVSKHEAEVRITGRPEAAAKLYRCTRPTWPLTNVWLGVSVEDQRRADERIPELLAAPAAVRFLSCEPLLEPVSFRWAQWDNWRDLNGIRRKVVDHLDGLRMLDWVIVGGESGPGARPMDTEWARSLRDQCAEAGVPFFMKQVGGSVKAHMPEIPADLMIRQFPRTAQAEMTHA